MKKRIGTHRKSASYSGAVLYAAAHGSVSSGQQQNLNYNSR